MFQQFIERLWLAGRPAYFSFFLIQLQHKDKFFFTWLRVSLWIPQAVNLFFARFFAMYHFPLRTGIYKKDRGWSNKNNPPYRFPLPFYLVYSCFFQIFSPFSLINSRYSNICLIVLEVGYFFPGVSGEFYIAVWVSGNASAFFFSFSFCPATKSFIRRLRESILNGKAAWLWPGLFLFDIFFFFFFFGTTAYENKEMPPGWWSSHVADLFISPSRQSAALPKKELCV